MWKHAREISEMRNQKSDDRSALMGILRRVAENELLPRDSIQESKDKDIKENNARIVYRMVYPRYSVPHHACMVTFRQYKRKRTSGAPFQPLRHALHLARSRFDVQPLLSSTRLSISRCRESSSHRSPRLKIFNFEEILRRPRDAPFL